MTSRLEECSDRLASIAIARGAAIRRRERGLEGQLLLAYSVTERAAHRALSSGVQARKDAVERVAADIRAAGVVVSGEMVGCGRLEEKAFREAVIRVSGMDWKQVPDDLIRAVVTVEKFQELTMRQWVNRIAVRTRRAVREVYRRVDNGELRGTEAREALRDALKRGRDGIAFVTATFCYRATAYVRELSFRINRKNLRGVVWLSVLDERTTVHICLPRAWKRYSLPGFKPIGHDRPWLQGPGRSHPRCRARMSVALRGCKWPTAMSGEKWLRTQSKGVQEEVLGVDRSRLWRSKAITLNQMIETDHQSLLTLDELAEHDTRVADLL